MNKVLGIRNVHIICIYSTIWHNAIQDLLNSFKHRIIIITEKSFSTKISTTTQNIIIKETYISVMQPKIESITFI